MIDSIEDAQSVAAALLATVKKLMTGSEIAACEWAKNPEFEDEIDWFLFGDEEDYFTGDDDYDEQSEHNSQIIVNKWHTLLRLETAFVREISDWQRNRNMALARRATKLSRVE